MTIDLQEILPEFQSFLRARDLAPDKSIPYYALWASRFLSFGNKKPNRDRETVVLEFLEYARSRWALAEWQMKQADEAIKLYLHHYKGPQAIHPDRPPLSDLSTILSDTRELLRLKHYSYRTEQTYLDWIKRFFDHLAKSKESSDSPPASLKAQSSQREDMPRKADRGLRPVSARYDTGRYAAPVGATTMNSVHTRHSLTHSPGPLAKIVRATEPTEKSLGI